MPDDLISRKEVMRLLKKERLLKTGKVMVMGNKILLTDDYVRNLIKSINSKGGRAV